MSEINTPLSPEASILPAWFNSEPGRALLGAQNAALKTLVPDQFYRVGLQFGMNCRAGMSDMNVEQAIYCDTGCAVPAESENNVIALPEALPLADSSVDLALLFHTLDYCDDPHRVLREISQVLSPEGVLVLTGFHPFSFWGARRRLSRQQAPFDARFISRSVVQGWLELLGFQTLTGCMLNYQVPQLNKRWRRRLEWMNKAGDRWWPTLGGVYILVLEKKVYGGIGAAHVARKKAKWFTGTSPASAKVLHKIAMKNRKF